MCRGGPLMGQEPSTGPGWEEVEGLRMDSERGWGGEARCLVSQGVRHLVSGGTGGLVSGKRYII